MIHHYGWKRQSEDKRDYRFSISSREAAVLPSKFSLRPKMPLPDNQLNIGACGPNSGDVLLKFDRSIQTLPYINTSRLFSYYVTRSLMGTINEDSGVDNRTLLKAYNQYGYCDEAICPYVPADFTKTPPQEAYTAAALNRISNYASVAVKATDMKTVIFQGHPFLFGAEVFQGIESDQAAHTGFVPMPSGSPIGGHDVVFCGWDDGLQCFEFEMPWGKDWGLNGFGWWPYAYATNVNLAADFWVVNAVPGSVDPGPPPVPTTKTFIINIPDGLPAGQYKAVAA